MTISRDSRFVSALPAVVPIDASGDAIENVRLDLPYPRPVITAERRPDVTQYTVRGGDTWHTLGLRFMHGQAQYWWAIAEFSGVIDPFTELAPGKTTPNAGGTLTVPSFETVAFELIGGGS